MPDPTPDPVPAGLTGWQLVIVECVKMLVPVALAVVAIFRAGTAIDAAADANKAAAAAHVEAAKRPVFYAPAPARPGD